MRVHKLNKNQFLPALATVSVMFSTGRAFKLINLLVALQFSNRNFGVLVGRRACLLILMLAILCAPNSINACRVCAITATGLMPKHPHSLQIAVAIRRELDLGLLMSDEQVLTKEDIESDESRFWSLMSRRKFLTGKIDILLIEDGRLHHVDAVGRSSSSSERIRVVTGRSVLQGLLDRRLHLETAVNRGLLVIEAEDNNVDHQASNTNNAS